MKTKRQGSATAQVPRPWRRGMGRRRYGHAKGLQPGNQTLVKTSTGIWSVACNAENRPVRFTRTEADGTKTRISCAYDYMGRRATKLVETVSAAEDGTETATAVLHQRYIYRGYLQIAACDLAAEGTPCLWGILWDPTQPVAARPLAIRMGGTWHAYGWDLTKNVCELFDSAGSIGASYSYAPYGAVATSGAASQILRGLEGFAPQGRAADGAAASQPIQWSSEFFDDELGLVYYNYRYYNPADGRWCGRDFLEEKEVIAIYAFISNKPTIGNDIIGLRMVAKDWLFGILYTDSPAEFDVDHYSHVEANCNTGVVTRVSIQTKSEISFSLGGEFKGFSLSVSIARSQSKKNDIELQCCKAVQYHYKFKCNTKKRNFFLWAVTWSGDVLKYTVYCTLESATLVNADITKYCPDCANPSETGNEK